MSGRRIRVVWISHSSNLDGAERSLVEAVKATARLGVTSQVVLPSRGELEALLEQEGIATTVLPHYPWWMALPHATAAERSAGRRRCLRENLGGALREVVGLLRSWRPDLVVTNTVTVPVGALAARLTRTPHIWHVREFGREDHGLTFYFGERLCLRLISKLSSRVTVVSGAVSRKHASHVAPERLRVVYSAVEVPSNVLPRELDPRAFNLVLVGRLSEAKRQEDAIRAAALLVRCCLPVRLTLVGDEHSGYGAFLRALTAELQVPDIVDFAGYQTERLRYLAACDVALICSRCEAFARATLEAMKLGRPVVGAASGGTPEQIRDGWNGFLYPTGNPEALAAHLKTLYHDTPLRASMGCNARSWACRTFSLDRFGATLMGVFQEALDERPAGMRCPADPDEAGAGVGHARR